MRKVSIMIREEFYKDIFIGRKTLDYRLQQEKTGNGITFSYTPFKVNNIEYYAIERKCQGWRSGKEYEIQDQLGNVVQGYYNKVKKQCLGINFNFKNRKELINRFTTIALNEDIEIKDTYYYEIIKKSI
jgi:hypothetical protein